MQMSLLYSSFNASHLYLFVEAIRYFDIQSNLSETIAITLVKPTRWYLDTNYVDHLLFERILG